jgi:hypothetical protein
MKRKYNDEHQQNVVKLLKLMNYKKTLKNQLPKTINTIIGFNPDVNKIKDVIEKIIKIINTSENIDAIYQTVINIYCLNYSHSEIKAMIKFYSSKNGKTILDKMNCVSEEILNSSMNWTANIITNNKDLITSIIVEKINEIEKYE